MGMKIADEIRTAQAAALTKAGRPGSAAAVLGQVEGDYDVNITVSATDAYLEMNWVELEGKLAYDTTTGCVTVKAAGGCRESAIGFTDDLIRCLIGPLSDGPSSAEAARAVVELVRKGNYWRGPPIKLHDLIDAYDLARKREER